MSQLTTASKEIGDKGYVYTVGKLDPFVATDLLVDLMKMFGPAVGAFGSGIVTTKDAVDKLLDGVPEGVDDDGFMRNLEKGFSELAKGLDKTIMRTAIVEFGKVTSVQVTPERAPQLIGAALNLHFRENFDDMYPWLFFCFGHQYTVFRKLGGTLTSLAGRALRTKVESKSPSTSSAIGGSTS